MSAHRFWQLFRGIKLLFDQGRHIEQKLDLLLVGTTLPPELVQKGKDLKAKADTLQAALNSAGQQPQQKGQ